MPELPVVFGVTYFAGFAFTAHLMWWSLSKWRTGTVIVAGKSMRVLTFSLAACIVWPLTLVLFHKLGSKREL